MAARFHPQLSDRQALSPLQYILKRIKHRRCPLPAKCDQPVAHDPIAQFVHKAHSSAFADYHPRAYPGSIVMFRATQRYAQDIFYKRDRAGGWDKVSSDVEAIDLPAAHHNIVSGPNAPVAADALRLYIHQRKVAA